MDRQGKRWFGTAQLGWVQQPWPWKQHAGLLILLYHDTDVAIGQSLVGSVEAVEHRCACGPVLHRSQTAFPQNGAVETVHPPGALADGAEGDPGLQSVQQCSCILRVGLIVLPAQRRGQGTELVLMGPQLLQQQRWQSLVFRLQPLHVVAGPELGEQSFAEP